MPALPPARFIRPTALLGLAGASLAIAALLGVGPDPRPDATFTYGEIAVDKNEAVLVTDRVIQRVEIPLQPTDANSPTIFKNGIGPYQKRFSPLLYTLNVFGAQGWEIVGDAPLKEGDRVLVRRRER